MTREKQIEQEMRERHLSELSAILFRQGAEWADAHNPEIAYLKHEIERLTSKLQAADDLNILLTAELENAKSPWISVEDRLPEDLLTCEWVAVKLKGYPGWYRGYYSGTMWHYIDECGDEIRFNVTHWMPIPELSKGGKK